VQPYRLAGVEKFVKGSFAKTFVSCSKQLFAIHRPGLYSMDVINSHTFNLFDDIAVYDPGKGWVL
jgi:hypothetical protein